MISRGSFWPPPFCNSVMPQTWCPLQGQDLPQCPTAPAQELGTGSAKARSYTTTLPTPSVDITTARGPGLALAAQQTALPVKILFSHKKRTVLFQAGFTDDISGVVAEVHLLTNLFDAILATTQLCWVNPIGAGPSSAGMRCTLMMPFISGEAEKEGLKQRTLSESQTHLKASHKLFPIWLRNLVLQFVHISYSNLKSLAPEILT